MVCPRLGSPSLKVGFICHIFAYIVNKNITSEGCADALEGRLQEANADVDRLQTTHAQLERDYQVSLTTLP